MPPGDRNSSNIVLDDKSKAIIRELQADGRRSYSAIGKVVDLSEAAVRQRVARMIEAGAMEIVAVTDPLQLGFARQAMIGIKVSGDIDVVLEALCEMDEPSYLVVTAGSFDLIVEVICESDHALFELINNRIRKIDGVTGTETFMYLKLGKQKYNWGTP